MKLGSLRFLLSLGAVLAGVLAWAAWPGKGSTAGGSRASGPLRSEFYVWQRKWDAAVQNAVRTAPETVAGLAPLCAEMIWTAADKPTVVRPKLDLDALLTTGRPISAVLRIGPRKPAESAQAEVCRVAREVVEYLRRGKIEPVELQVDFDCAESQLAGYRSWLTALRTTVAPIPVRPTVLPSWLARREFSELARDCGGYVLQVHATTRPRLDAPDTVLCEAADARRWVEQAGRLGVPFRVALPTYAYRVGFQAGGELLGIEAEGDQRAWPAGTVLRVFRPDPAQVAALVREWGKDRPASLTGLLWYRLPVATDTLNWRWPTLAAVLAGRAPRAQWRVEQSGASPTDLTLVNDGETDAPYPARISATSTQPIEAADAVGGYQSELHDRQVRFSPAPEFAAAHLPPGERLPLGWVRAREKIQIEISP